MYDEELAARVRDVLTPVSDVGEIKMFGGLCFTLHGNMCVGVLNDDLMVRLNPEQHEQAVAEPGARDMDFVQRPMRGFVFVDPGGVKTDDALRAWVERALAYVTGLPPKGSKDAKKRKKRA